jgi:DNA-binding NarL/FixJ family response regulator
MKNLNLILVEDDFDIRTTLTDFFLSCDEFNDVQSFESVELLEEAVERGLKPDIVLLDIQLPGKSGIEGIKFLKQHFEDIDIIMLTIFKDEHKIFDSLCAGATGYLLKNTPIAEIREGILSLHNGGSPMSPQIARKVIRFFSHPALPKEPKADLSAREKQIIDGLVDGLSYKLIADACFISIDTVRFHIKNIYKKLQVNSKGEVISKVLKGNL